MYVYLMPVPHLSPTLSSIFEDIDCCSCPVVNVSVGLSHALAQEVPAALTEARRGFPLEFSLPCSCNPSLYRFAVGHCWKQLSVFGGFSSS